MTAWLHAPGTGDHSIQKTCQQRYTGMLHKFCFVAATSPVSCALSIAVRKLSLYQSLLPNKRNAGTPATAPLMKPATSASVSSPAVSIDAGATLRAGRYSG